MLALTKTLRAAVLGLALTGAAVTAMPAQAQPTVEFGFSFGDRGGGWYGHRPDRRCLSDRDVRQLVRSHGYRDIRFADRDGRIVVVRAERGPRDYRITVDACRGRIIDVDRIRRR